jgi:hypothetical protein
VASLHHHLHCRKDLLVRGVAGRAEHTRASDFALLIVAPAASTAFRDGRRTRSAWPRAAGR